MVGVHSDPVLEPWMIWLRRVLLGLCGLAFGAIAVVEIWVVAMSVWTILHW